jgi:hypothetical protein
VVVTIGLLAAACSGGGGSGDAHDALGLGQGETVVQFEGASKLRMGGTLAMPDRAARRPVGAVLIVPSVARNDRNGYIDVVPGDAVYQDLSQAITEKGMAAFRYDRRSMGTSRLEPRVTAALPQSFDPNDHRAHGGGRPPDTATRDPAAVDQITAFLSFRIAAPRQ